jgi:hypothetical protein
VVQAVLDEQAEQDAPISPELALVDPVLAEWARSRLRDRCGTAAEVDRAESRSPSLPQPLGEIAPVDATVEPDVSVSAQAAWSHQLATIPARPARARASTNGRWSGPPAHRPPLPKAQAEAGPRFVVSHPAADDRRESPRHVGRFIRRAALFSLAAVVVGGVVLAFPRSHVARERAQSRSIPARVTPPAGSSAGGGAAKPAGGKPSSAPLRPPSKRAGAARARRNATPTPAAAGTSPTFAWAPEPGAVGYEVQFFRGQTRILVRRTVAPRLSLPRQWVYGGQRMRLTPGTYRWYVWPLRRSAHPGRPPVKQHKAAYASLWTWP